jgi:endonuclease/exonuclease/phosphatase (EEP) superfamily protein YafD
MGSADSSASKKARLHRMAYWAVLLQWAAIVAFLAALFVGESWRLTLILLYLPRQPFLVLALLGFVAVYYARRRKKLLLGGQIVALLVVLFPVMGLSTGHARKATTDHPIHLFSYNIYFGKLSRAGLLSEIAASDADIVLLQATYDSILKSVKDRFPDRYANRVDDFVLVSKFKIRSVDEPPPLPDGELPKFVGYVLETPAGPLRVYNVHPFSPRHALFEDRDADLNLQHRDEQFAAAIAAARNESLPTIVVGDTNLPPGSAIARRNLGPLKDAFEQTSFGFGYTFPSKRTWMRIDRAFAKEEDIHFLDFRVGDKGASDHRPIYVDFELTPH